MAQIFDPKAAKVGFHWVNPFLLSIAERMALFLKIADTA